MNIREVFQKFTTDDECLAYLEQMRWPDGVARCPVCGTDKPAKVERKATSKNRRKWFYLCSEKTCRNQFSPTSGTIFHDTHLPLIVWFHAIALILNAKKGMSAAELKRQLGIGGYKTAWYLNHRIREAMTEGDIPKLGGIVEIDELYVGGRVHGKGQRVAKSKKLTVMGARQRTGGLRLELSPNAKIENIARFVFNNVDCESVERVMTDEHPAYPKALRALGLIAKHETVNHSKEEYVVGDTYTNTIESAFSLLRRGIIGQYHKLSIKHLQRYLNEFAYRFNRRNSPDAFIETVARLCKFGPLTYSALISSEKA